MQQTAVFYLESNLRNSGGKHSPTVENRDVTMAIKRGNITSHFENVIHCVGDGTNGMICLSLPNEVVHIDFTILYCLHYYKTIFYIIKK